MIVDEQVTLYCGDNVATMQQMESDSIDLVVTSPPYDNLRKGDTVLDPFSGSGTTARMVELHHKIAQFKEMLEEVKND
jgi:DNA modification methylase